MEIPLDGAVGVGNLQNKSKLGATCWLTTSTQEDAVIYGIQLKDL